MPDRHLNPRAVSEIAAQLYWHQAEDIGVAATTTAIAESRGTALFDHPSAAAILSSFGFDDLPAERQETCRAALKEEALDYALAERNMIGQIYLEDISTGRSASAAELDTRHLAHIPELTATGPIERCGRLCLRHPLPAIVFADVNPADPFILVDDTRTALGFDMPMLMTIDGRQEHEGVFILTGIFQIPVPSISAGAAWNHAVQNSTRFTAATTLISDRGITKVTARWKRQGVLSKLFRR